MLDFPRFSFLPKSDLYTQSFADPGDLTHDFNFKYYGYRSVHLMANLNYIPVFAAFIALFWLAAALKDLLVCCICCCRVRGLFSNFKHESWVFNVGVRFIYEVFLELSLCAILTLAHADEASSEYFSALAILGFQGFFILHAFAAQGSPLLRY